MEVALLDQPARSAEESTVCAYIEAGLFIVAGLVWVAFWRHHEANPCGDHTYCSVGVLWSLVFLVCGAAVALLRDFFMAESEELVG